VSCPGGFDNLKAAYSPTLGASAWYTDIRATNATCATAVQVIDAYGKGTNWSLTAKYKTGGFDCVSIVHQLAAQEFTGAGTCTNGAVKVTWVDPPGD
jgi:hypothetical protein